MKNLRLSKLLPLACLAVCGTTMASATAVSTPTGTADGSYTYVFTMPDATFTLYTVDGPIGAGPSMGNGYNYSISPTSSYPSFTAQVGTGETNSIGVYDVEILIQFSGNLGNEDYYFTEPISFWQNLGAQTFAPAFTPGDFSPYINDGVVEDIVTCGDTTCTNNDVQGQVYEGATFADFPQTPDPDCVGCSVTTSFVPASVTPEPSSLALLSTGVAAALGVLRRRRGSR